ncbi:MAG: hypothetical protein ACI965_002139 [Paraglaciecola sp.]|jgi:hypothetical protein
MAVCHAGAKLWVAKLFSLAFWVLCGKKIASNHHIFMDGEVNI